ncbi:hypothetical protein BpHYR1_044152 [Brachionus plicatilis]|uniref:Uncharacterized protein n=1 Tax=Brachionus plicatilis TaxID=10195 RepID=A0A3M7SE20_BRAPC|nr:hypothetical protein BpHYR1_044152 [Brachionus plicatilis]
MLWNIKLLLADKQNHKYKKPNIVIYSYFTKKIQKNLILNDLKKKTSLNRKPIFNHPFIYLIPDTTEGCFVTGYS